MESEPFPLLNTSADHFPESNGASTVSATSASRRRKSSVIAAELRGDTGAPALATSLAHMNGGSLGKQVLAAKSSGTISSPTRRKASTTTTTTTLGRIQRYALKHTWALPLFLLTTVLTAYALNPTESNPASRFIFLSYKLSPEVAASMSSSPIASPYTQYGKGKWDIALVAFYAVFLSFTREFIMVEILKPLAKRAGLSRAKQARFMEQMYTATYFGIIGPAGMYVMSRTPVWYFDVVGMYQYFPHMTHDACFKFYYLFQAAYWSQQFVVLVLGLEKPRKDYWELVGHHIVSLVLIGMSYRFHFTYIGLAVYITHDVSDFFLATSKSLSYVESPLVLPYFFLFMGVWIYMRHYLNIRLLHSLFYEFRTVGPYEINWETQQYKGWLANTVAIVLLGSLQCLNLFWFFLITRIALRFAVKGDAADDREDGDDDGLDVATEDEEFESSGGGSGVGAGSGAGAGKEEEDLQKVLLQRDVGGVNGNGSLKSLLNSEAQQTVGNGGLNGAAVHASGLSNGHANGTTRRKA